MVIMMILWYVSVEDMILNGSSSFEIFWTTDYVDSKVRKVHANFPIQIGIFSNIFEKWQGKNFLKQGKNFHTSDKVKTSSNKVKRSQGKNFLKQGKNFHRESDKVKTSSNKVKTSISELHRIDRRYLQGTCLV